LRTRFQGEYLDLRKRRQTLYEYYNELSDSLKGGGFLDWLSDLVSKEL
jgi:hypothetical protein